MDNLQDLLNKLTDKGRLAFGLYKDAQFILDEYSLNDLCSISSGLWQFVCEKEFYVEGSFPTNPLDRIDILLFDERYRLMLSSIQEDKEKFLLENIVIND